MYGKSGDFTIISSGICIPGILVKTEQTLVTFAGTRTPGRRNEKSFDSEGDVRLPRGKGVMKGHLVLR